MFDAVSVLLSSLARRPVPRRRGKSITSSAFIARRPFFPCGAGHRDVSASPFAKPRTLRRLKPRRIGEWKGGRDDGNGDLLDGDEPCVWRRTILLGRRCQPLEFTGAIHYDSEGQRLWRPRTTPLLTSPIHSSELGYMDRA